MDDRPGSPEIDVVGEGENSKTFRHRTERFCHESTNASLRAANKNGANRLAANTNKERKKAETVNLRVRNMGVITVKKEPESDEDREVSYSLSSLLEECDFDNTPRKRALKSPTSLAIAKAKSVESVRQTGPAQGRPRQSLENVISSLKSARAVTDYQPKLLNRPLNIQSPVTPISVPSQIISAAPAPMLGSVIGPQIVDVRSLASVVRPSMTDVVQGRQHELSIPLNAGHQRRCVVNSVVTTPGLSVTQGRVSTAALGVATSTHTPGTQRQVSAIATSTVASGTKPVNIRFVLPANVPFNTDQFQQVLQATLASLSSQSKTIEPNQLQQAIQAALTSVTKSTVAFNSDQLQQAIQNSLAAVTASVPVPQVTPPMLAPAAVYMPKGAQRQPQTIAPKPPLLPLQPTVLRADTFFADSNKSTSGNAIGSTTEKQISLSASVVSPVTSGIETVTKTIDSSPVVNTCMNGNKGLSQSHLASAREALVKALQTNRLNSPASSAVSPPSANTDLLDDDTFSSLPPITEAPVPSSDCNIGNLIASSNHGTSLSRSVPQTTSVASNKIPPSPLPLDSQTYLGQNACPVSPGTQSNAGKCSCDNVSVQSITPTHLKPTSTPVITSMASATTGNKPIPMLSSSTAPTHVPVSNTTSVNLQISVPVNIKNTPVNNTGTKTKKSTAQGTKSAPATGCGCCSNCKYSKSEESYKCQFLGCDFLCNTLQGLRKHHYFNPIHKPQIPLEKATHSVDYFLPSELGNCHRNARLRELFKRLSNDEIMEHVMPRMTKCVSLSDFLEMKSARAQPSRGQPDISAFKMFSEFERFRKEVESRLLQLILLPQGRAGKREKKEEVNNAPGAAKDSSIVEPAKQEKKDALLLNTISSDQKPESSASQPSSQPDSSAPTKKTIETICIDSEPAGTNTPHTSLITESQKGDSTTVDKPSPSQGELPCAGEDVKNTNDLSSLEKKPDEAVKDSSEGESVEASKQSVLRVTSLEVGTEAKESTESSDIKPSGDQPSGSEKPTEMTGSNATETVAKDSTPQPMETDEEQKKDVSAADSEKPAAQLTDVTMVDAEKKTEPLSKEGELKESNEEKVKAPQDACTEKIEIDTDTQAPNADIDKLKTEEEKLLLTAGSEETPKAKDSQDPCIEKIEIDTDNRVPNVDTDKLKTEEEKRLLTTGSEEKPKEHSEKTNLVSVEIKEDADEAEKKDSVAAEKVEDKNRDAAEVVDETATSGNTENVPAVVNVDEHVNDSQKDIDKHKPGDVTEEKSGEEKITDTGSGTEQAPQVSTDKGEQGDVDGSKVADEGCKEASKENNLMESEVSKSNDKTDKTNAQPTTQKEPQNPSAKSSKVDVSENGSSSAEVSSSNKAPFSAAADVTPMSNADAKVAQNNDTPLCTALKEEMALITIGEDEDIDENNLLEFGLPFAIKWGKVVKKTQTLEARKIARKEKYSEQDMKQFIYGKPKDAANAVISSECHAHPSFFRAYVMPALLDKHIDDFGLFGKKILSRLYLSRTKYVDVLRSSIGPELAKILGINIFPTFKRIMDTWEIVKMLPPGGTAKNPLVLAPMPEDRREVPDDEDEPVPACATVVRTVNNVQNAVTRVNDSLKRPGPAVSEQNDNNKKQRLDNTGAQKVASQVTSDKEASQPSDTKNGQKADVIDSTGEKAQDDKSQSDGSQKEQTDSEKNQKETTSASDKSARPGTKENNAVSPNSTGAPKEKQPSVGISSAGPASKNKPGNSADHAYSKSAATIIPKKAMIYTGDAGKKGASPLPLSSAKGSPLYLVPVEKLAPKLIEQFINQAKGEGVKTRSATSSAKKPKQPKQGSQVFVLVPSSNPNGSPMIQTLTSEDQLKSSGDKKPLLLLPADKVPKSMASQTPTMRRKMVITMVTSSGTTSAAQSTAQCVATTSGASPVGQQNDSDSSKESVSTSIMTAKEINTDSSKTAATPSKEVTSGDPKPAVESADASLVSVVNNTKTLHSLTNDGSLAKDTETGSSSVNQGDSTVSKESDAEVIKLPVCTEETSSVQNSEPAATPTVKPVTSATQSTTSAAESATHSPESNMSIDAKEKAEDVATSGNKSTIDSQGNGGLDILGSSLLPSDLTLDNLLKDITGDGSGSNANDMPPLDISEVISSFEDFPVESDSSSHDNVAATCTVKSDSSSLDNAVATCTVESDSETRSCSQGSALDDDRNPNARRQSPRRTPAAPSKSTPVSSLADVSSPNTSGGSREDSDTEDGSPPRKRRKAPMRTSAKSSPQVTFVHDKEVPGKGSTSKTKGRKQ